MAKRCAINPKTVAKWKKRSFTHDLTEGDKRQATRISKDALQEAELPSCLVPLCEEMK